jgi:hypothetical protein
MKATGLMNDAPGEKQITLDGTEYKRGDKVRLTLGKRRSDPSDSLMDGRVATIENIYLDYDDKVHFAVTLDDDPGQPLMREMGIYKYFGPGEVELMAG